MTREIDPYLCAGRPANWDRIERHWRVVFPDRDRDQCIHGVSLKEHCLGCEIENCTLWDKVTVLWSRIWKWVGA